MAAHANEIINTFTQNTGAVQRFIVMRSKKSNNNHISRGSIDNALLQFVIHLNNRLTVKEHTLFNFPIFVDRL